MTAKLETAKDNNGKSPKIGQPLLLSVSSIWRLYEISHFTSDEYVQSKNTRKTAT